MAEEKAAALAGAGASVRRMSPFDPEKAYDAFMIVAVVEEGKEAGEIKQFADENRILLNVVDQTENCHFIAPAIVERGDLLIAISTSGKSPALARKIRQELETQFGFEYASLLTVLGEIRPLVRERFDSFEQRKRFYQHLVQLDLLDVIRTGGQEVARARLRKAIEESQVVEEN
jgi:precorrin-2 dehydrogenase/sirohydrochlorin ferrochelatase